MFDSAQEESEQEQELLFTQRPQQQRRRPAVTRMPIPNGLPARRVVSERVKEVPPSPPHLFPLHTVITLVGACNSGKSHQAVSLVRDYVDYGCFDRVMVVSPTFASNPCFDAISDVVKVPDDVYTQFGREHAAIADIEQKVVQAGNKYRDEKRYQKAYEDWIAAGRDADALDVATKALLEKEEYREPRDELMPSICVIIDDCSHSSIFTHSCDNPFTNLCLRHRHIGGIGLSIIFCVQTWKSGVPRALRQGCIRQICIFPTKDHSQLDSVYEEVGNLVSKEQFMSLYRTATRGNDHNFLLIDVAAPGDTYAERKMMRFRKNWDQVLVPDSVDSDDSDYEVKEDDSDTESGSVLWTAARPDKELQVFERGSGGGGGGLTAPSAAARGSASSVAGLKLPAWSNGFGGWQAIYAAQAKQAEETNRSLVRQARAAVAVRGGRRAAEQVRIRASGVVAGRRARK